jgi:large subunit ribosomal protein L23
MSEILIKPLVTEKMTGQNEKGYFGFVVDKDANKVQIRKAVEKMYGVKVLDVNTAVLPGKKKTRYSKARVVAGHSGSFKKAFVKLADGEMIDFYSGI